MAALKDSLRHTQGEESESYDFLSRYFYIDITTALVVIHFFLPLINWLLQLKSWLGCENQRVFFKLQGYSCVVLLLSGFHEFSVFYY